MQMLSANMSLILIKSPVIFYKQEKTFKSIWALSFNRIGERKKKKKTKNKKRPVTQITRVLSDHTQHRHAVIFCY